MITLDAGVFLALFNSYDAHHAQAEALLTRAVEDDELLYIGQVNQAEVLIHPTEQGKTMKCLEFMERIGVTVLGAPYDEGLRLAQIRAETGLKLPDCAVILTADQSGSRIATFDAKLANAAQKLGIDVVA